MGGFSPKRTELGWMCSSRSSRRVLREGKKEWGREREREKARKIKEKEAG